MAPQDFEPLLLLSTESGSSQAVEHLVQSLSPAEGSTDQAIDSSITVTFKDEMDTASVSVQSSDGVCTESIQISTDSFATCLGGSLTTGNKIDFSFTPSKPFRAGSTILLRVLSTVRSASGRTGPEYTSTGFTTFSPGDYGGLVLWLRANTIDQNDNTPVSTWTDESGNGHNADQSTAARQPVLRTGIINNQPVVRFDGANDDLLIAESSAYKSGVIQLFLVIQVNVGGMNQIFISYPHAATHTSPYARWNFSATIGGNVNMRIDFNNITSGGVYGGWSNFSIFSYDTVNRDVFADGNLFFDGTAQTVTYNASTPGLRIGSNADGNERLNGDIAEVLLWTTALSTAERERVHCYLSRKYAIALGHGC